jgi:hypothetical protein
VFRLHTIIHIYRKSPTHFFLRRHILLEDGKYGKLKQKNSAMKKARRKKDEGGVRKRRQKKEKAKGRVTRIL